MQQQFEGPTIRDAVASVKSALGPEAVILGTREVTDFFGRKRVVVQAEASESTNPLHRSVHAPSSQDLNELRDLLTGARDDVPQPRQPVSGAPDAHARLLAASDVEPNAIESIMQRVSAQRGGDVVSALADLLGDGGTPRFDTPVVAVVGPTGVGKTTTVAKLAARAALVQRKRVGVITTDTFRVGAVDQIRHYAELVGVPLAVVRDRSMLEQVVRRWTDMDLILVDTAGRNPSDRTELEFLSDLLRNPVARKKIAVHLAVCASTRRVELVRALDRFAPLNPHALLVTKMDEAMTLGTVANAVWRSKLALSYVTTGQRVPEDIERANPLELARDLMRRARGLSEELLELASGVAPALGTAP